MHNLLTFFRGSTIMYFTYNKDTRTPHLMAKLTGEIITISNTLANLFNYNHNPKKPASFHQLLIDNSNYSSKLASEVIDKIKAKEPVIDVIIKFNCHNAPVLLSIMLVVDDNGNQLLYVVSRNARLIAYPSLLVEPLDLGLVHDKFTVDTKKRLESLGQLEHAIVFLLSIGLKQREIGELLGYTRGYIASIITHKICPVFGIRGGSSKMLVKIMRGLYLVDDKIPELVANKVQPMLL